MRTIPAGFPSLGFAYNPLNNKVYCGSEVDEVMVIDGFTNTVITTIEVRAHGWMNSGLIYNTINNKIYCATSHDNSVAVIDGLSDTVITHIDVGNGPYTFAWNHAQNRTYVANFDDNTVSVIRDVTGVEEDKISVVEDIDLSPTIFRGHLQLPEGKKCRVYDITGRVVEPNRIQPGVYFIEFDGVVTQKVVKVR